MYNSGVRGRRGADGYGIISSQDQFIQSKLSYPSITGYNACNVSQVILDDTAVTPGGYMLLYGTAFTTGMTLTIGTATVSSYTLVNTGRIFLTVPITLITGTYNVSIFSSTGGGAIFTTLLVSGFPTFTQTTYSVLGTTVVNVQLLVAGDAPLTYSLGSASTLPPGVSLSGTGLLSGTITPFSGNAQTYSFNINVDDAQAQTTTQLITLSVTLGDTYWPNNTLLLDSNTPGNVNTFVTDASLNNNIATIVGDTRPNNINPYQAGYYSNYFDGTGDYLTWSGTTVGTGAMTFECWFYYTGSFGGIAAFIGPGSAITGGLNCYINNSTSFAFDRYGVSASLYTVPTIAVNTWNHVAFVRNSSNVATVFFNGVRSSTGTASDTYSYTTSAAVGWCGGAVPRYFTGYISNARLVVGSNVYDPTQSTITVPTAPLTAIANTSLLTCQSNRFIDNSINNFAITKNGDTTVSSFIPFLSPTSTTVNTLYSTYFDGTGDSIRISPDNAVFQMGTGDFTVEAWVNPTALSASAEARIWSYQDTGGSAINLILLPSSSASVFAFYIRSNGATGANQTNGTTTAVVGTWYHVAFSRYSGTTKLFVNGIQEGSTGTTQTQTITAGTAAIGYYPTTPSEYFTGYVSNIRIVKGVGVYTGNFTVPISNLTATQSSGTNIAAITGLQTSLLTCQNSTIIDNSNNALTSSISSNGDARPLAVSPFTQTTTSVSLTNLGSTYFDGTGDQLTYANNPLFVFGAGNFTIDFWLYPLGSNQSIMNYSNGQAAQGNYSWEIFQNSTTRIQMAIYDGGGGTGYTAFSDSIPLIYKWNHIAVVRTVSTLSIYVNGVAGTTVTVTGVTVGNLSGATLKISGYNNATYMYTGYIEDVRIVKGTALYTANFAPPVAQSTTTSQGATASQVGLLTCQTSQPTNNSMYLDNSSLSSIVTRAGNTAQGSFSPYGLNWSQFFPSAGATYAVPGTGTSTALALGAGSFTIECWLYLNSLAPSYTTLFDWRTNGFTPSGVPIISDNNNNGTLCFIVGTGAAVTTLLTSSSVMPINSWFHLAVVRSGTALAMYFNGVSVATGTSSVDFGIQTFNIGNPQATNYGAPMYVTNVRMVKGTAVYTTAFSPPTTPLTSITNTQLLAFQNSGTQIDNSPNNFNVSKITTITSQRFSPFSTTTQTPLSYGGYFDGTGDYLITPNIGSITADFTIEYWYYPEVPTNTWYPYIFGSNTPWVTGIGMSYNTQVTVTDATDMTVSVAGVSFTVSTFGAIKNRWNHIAVVRSGSIITVYLNGVSTGTLTNSSTIVTTTFYIGGVDEGGQYDNHAIKGNISNFRIVKGVAVYTSTFTPPTSPLTATQTANINGSPSAAITGVQTSLLTCQSTTFIDNSTNNYTITVNGNSQPRTFNPFGVTVTQGSPYTPALFGGSGYFDGSGDYLQLANNPTYCNLNGVNFTIECWAYATTVASNICLLACAANPSTVGVQFFILSGNLTIYVNNGNTIVGSIAFPVNSWNHVAFVRNGTTCTLYLNGVFVASATVNVTNPASTQPFVIGGITTSTGWNSNLYLTGYMADVRVVNGVAVYTTPFVPPITPLTVTNSNTSLFVNMTKAGIPDYTRSIDLETVGDARLITESAYNGNYYSNYFNAVVGDQLSVPNNSVFDFAANNFTIEGWFYQLTSAAVSQPIVTKYSSVQHSFYIGAYNGFWDIVVSYGSISSVTITSNTIAIVLGVWNHFALVRNGANYQFFVNGVQVVTSSNVQTMATSSWAVVIGGADGRNFYFPGYIADVRLINGQALVTSAFTPSTTPLTATTVGHTGAGAAASITGTVALLTCQSNKFVDNSGNNFTFTRVGAPLVKSFNPFILNTPTSMSFDGTGDYLVTGGNSSTGLNAFGTGDFTIEFWLYENSVAASDQGLIDMRPASTNGYYPYLYSYNGTIVYWLNSAAVITSAASSIIAGVWYYITLTRSGSSTRLFINGVQAGSTYTNATALLGDNNRPVIGCAGTTLGASPLNGYIEDLRITKGVARYTGNFTVPTNKLPTF